MILINLGGPQIKARNRRKQVARERAEEWRTQNPERYRQQMEEFRKRRGKWHELSRRYGVTEFQFDAMFIVQGGLCLGCDEKMTYPTGACLDHDHKTRQPRGLLCRTCNWAVGHAQDRPQVLRNLAAYLESPTWGRI